MPLGSFIRLAREVKSAAGLVQKYGVRWLAFRLTYALRARLGLLRLRTPPYEWADRPLRTWLKPGIPSEEGPYAKARAESSPVFFFDTLPDIGNSVSSEDCDRIIEEAEEILNGSWRFFSRQRHELGFPPDWHMNPTTRQRPPRSRHWSQIGDFEHGDIKFLWELSRFGFAYHLVRAYAVNGDERFPVAFWQLVENWADENPPQRGVHWKCGQEASFRVMAWCFAFYGFARSRSSSAGRRARLVAMIAAHAVRIHANIDYARWQKNNHALSEAGALWTVGVLFPELSCSRRWKTLGADIIEEEVRRQIYPDGSYIQHSCNYHRVMLDDLMWAMRLGELNDCRFSDDVYERVGLAVDMLFELQDCVSGKVPNIGSNDGALVLPLSTCSFEDYRPHVQAANYLVRRNRLFDVGPWDEALLWMFGGDAMSAAFRPRERRSISASSGGYYTIRGEDSWALIRCAWFKDRPGHMDQLHFDLWWKGENVLCDAGTYSYNSEPPWNNGLVGTRVHNTVTVDGRDQMTRAGRFLSTEWACGSVLSEGSSEGWQFWLGMHDGYRNVGVIHRRTVLCNGRIWWILDDLETSGNHQHRLHWLLPDWPFSWTSNETSARLTLNTPIGRLLMEIRANRAMEASAAKGCNGDTRGWRSLYYGEKDPSLSLAAETCATGPVRFCTFIREPAARPSEDRSQGRLVPEMIQEKLSGWQVSEINKVLAFRD